MATSVYKIRTKIDGVDKAASSMGDLERAVNSTAERFQMLAQVGQEMQQLGNAISSVESQIMEAGRGLDRNLTNIQNIAGLTAEEAYAASEALSELTAQSGNLVTQQIALESAYDAASAGFIEAADAAGVFNAAQRAAISGTTGLQDATEVLIPTQKAIISTLKGFSGELEQYGDVAEQAAVASEFFDQTIRLGITNASELAPAIAELAPVFNTAGQSIEDMFGALAQLTSQGVKANIAATQIKAAVGALADIDRVVNTLADLGIQIDAQALSSASLIEQMRMLKDAGVDYQAALAIMGMEGASAFGGLTADIEETARKTATFTGELDNLSQAVELKASDSMGQFTGSLNRFNDAMAKAGQSAIEAGTIFGQPIKSALLDAATDLLIKFTELPPAVQGAIGTLAQLGGVGMSTAGQLINLAANIAMAATAYTQLGVAAKAAALAQGAMVASTKAVTASLGAAKVALGAIASVTGGVVIAIGALSLALVEMHRNMDKIEANENLDILRGQTEVLAQKATTMGIKIRESGEAIPDDEFRRFIDLLKEAQGDSDVLQLQIDALTRVQDRAKASTDKAAQATADASQAQTEHATATDENTQAIEEQRSALELLNDSYQAQLGQAQLERDVTVTAALESGGGESEVLAADMLLYSKRLELAKQHASDLRAQLSQASPEDRAEVEKAVLAADSAVASERLKIAERNAQERQRIEQENAQKAEEAHREALAKKEAFDSEYLANLQRATDEANRAIEQSQLDRIAAVKQAQLDGLSDEEANRRLAQIEADRLNETLQSLEREKQAVKQAVADNVLSRKDGAAQAEQIQIRIAQVVNEQLDKEIAAQKAATDARIAEIDRLAQATRARGQLDSDRLSLAERSLSNQNSLLSAQSQLVGAVGNLEIARLETARKKAEESGNESAAERISEQISRKRLEIEQQQLAIKEKQLEATIRMQQIEAQRGVKAAQLAVKEGELGIRKAEASGADSETIGLMREDLELRKQALAAAQSEKGLTEEIAQLQRQTLEAEKQLSNVENGGSLDLPPNAPLLNPSWSDPGFASLDNGINNVQSVLDMTGKTISDSLQSQASQTAKSSDTLAQATSQAGQNTIETLNRLGATVEGATQSLNSTLSQLPSAIAQAMPRPSPTKR